MEQEVTTVGFDLAGYLKAQIVAIKTYQRKQKDLGRDLSNNQACLEWQQMFGADFRQQWESDPRNCE